MLKFVVCYKLLIFMSIFMYLLPFILLSASIGSKGTVISLDKYYHPTRLTPELSTKTSAVLLSQGWLKLQKVSAILLIRSSNWMYVLSWSTMLQLINSNNHQTTVVSSQHHMSPKNICILLQCSLSKYLLNRGSTYVFLLGSLGEIPMSRS